MRRVLSFFTCLLVLATNSSGQEITRQEADSMIKVLSRTKSGIDRMELLLNLAQFHIFKPGENQVDFDSAMIFIKEAEGLNKSVQSPAASGYLLLTEAYLKKEEGNKDEGKKMVEKAITFLEPGNNKLYLGMAYYELSQYYSYYEQTEYPRKIVLVEQALKAFQQSGNRERTAATLTMLGDLYCRKQNYPGAIDWLNKALAIYDTLKYDKLQAVYVLFGQSYRGLGDEVQALSYFLKALKTAQRLHDTTMVVCQIDHSLAGLYNRIDNKEMAIKYWSEGLAVAKKYKDEFSILLLSGSISNAYNNLGQPKLALKILDPVSKSFLKSEDPWRKCFYISSYFRTYLNFKQYGTAALYRDSLTKLLEDSVIDDESRSSICRLLTTYYFATKQYTKARQYLKLNFEIADGIHYEPGLTQGSQLWYQLDSAEGNYQSAFQHLHHYKTKMDSIFTRNKIKQLQVLGVEYETEMKEDSIKLKDKDISLLTQQNHLQQSYIKQASLIQNITIAGIVVAFFISGLIYRQYRQKQKSNNIISRKNEQLQHLLTEKEWLVKEIHHRVKNNLQMVVSLLNAQTEFLTHPSALDAIKESRERMQAIAIIHQKLYQLDNSTQVSMRSYINDLIDNIKNSFADSERIYFKLDVDDIILDISQSVPLGLILNEAITNAVKYAYSKNERGGIRISLQYAGSKKLQLKIADNGRGLPGGISIDKSNSLGLQLIKLFSEQLEGELYFINNNGLEITLNFKTAEYKNVTAIKATA